MNHSFYIIYSNTKDKFYIGETEDITLRLHKHNNHSYKRSFTKIAKDWHVVLDYKCATKKDALFLETFVKRMKSRKFIHKIIENNEILKDILTTP
ncbi:GIY-YIG nuclease family protein [Bizionia argentinensis JUB59]|uniref:GIY-YIG nuclease family protein n=1 Tax=Bizionia argentinensis JUB59 TaxID=1046627 RepID=G2EDW7_9FLAO|nr:GIY-YIG nuclease family protein [Bizionia argentinensis]EGV43328.1 GIY-YIG nuclease family protein [Bizionia argentinensis JUB59]